MNAGAGVLLAFGAALAFTNGANDVSKGVATLVGSGACGYRRAIAWGTATTAAGALVGGVAGAALVQTFGAGLFAAGVTPSLGIAGAALAGAAGWVWGATRLALPVSTTHALVGALAGAGTVAFGPGGIAWSALAGKVALPLLLSPAVSAVATWALVRTSRGLGLGSARPDCLCAEWREEPVVRAVSPGSEAAVSAWPVWSVVAAGAAECRAERPGAMRLDLDRVHWLSSGATGFARGMNDAPKIAGLCLAGSGLAATSAPAWGTVFLLVAGAMALGGVLAGGRVTRLLAEGVTRLDPTTGVASSLVTAALVGLGATAGLPMSTTHVSSAAVAGAGVADRSVRGDALRAIAAAWLLTVPGAAVLGAVAAAAVGWSGVGG